MTKSSVTVVTLTKSLVTKSGVAAVTSHTHHIFSYKIQCPCGHFAHSPYLQLQNPCGHFALSLYLQLQNHVSLQLPVTLLIIVLSHHYLSIIAEDNTVICQAQNAFGVG
ncbi:hypothetical protein BsWGS_17401 [Bradybaena similaris]